MKYLPLKLVAMIGASLWVTSPPSFAKENSHIADIDSCKAYIQNDITNVPKRCSYYIVGYLDAVMAKQPLETSKSQHSKFMQRALQTRLGSSEQKTHFCFPENIEKADLYWSLKDKIKYHTDNGIPIEEFLYSSLKNQFPC